MSWHFEFNAATRADALRVWDQKVIGVGEYVRKEAAQEFAVMRACIERLLDSPQSFWSIKTYGNHARDETKAERPTQLLGIFFELKRGSLE